MIEFEKEYKDFIVKNGVGENDKVASSVKSYISYLNSIAKYLDITIEPNKLCTENDIEIISLQLDGKVAGKTIQNYKSAMKQYIKMVDELKI
ncbi:MAG: hypothetical protein U9N59_08165 [Campylobacterota bacterium]|nr:hypothetical protein [Campylobacterota bacterium]